VHLVAEYIDGSLTEGEAKIPKTNIPIKRVYLTDENAQVTPEALTTIAEADIIVLGPGSLYTSIIPNLIIKGMPEAIVNSSAYKIYVCNVMTQPGETDGFSASDHIRVLTEHSNPDIINACILNNASVPEIALQRYHAELSFPVAADVEKIKNMGYKVVATDLLGIDNYVRHDSKKMTQTLIKLIESQRVVKR
jgi:uncharacterized cofD-like protein